MNTNNILMNTIISISFPKDILEEANKYIPSQKRSKAIVKAFSLYLNALKKKKTEEVIGQMYDSMTNDEKEELLDISEIGLQDIFEEELTAVK